MKNIEEIMQTLTLEEKASLCQGATFWNTVEIPEKGIPSILVTDGPHGLRKQTGAEDNFGLNDSIPATCFPSAAAIGNSWNKELIYKIGEALGEECLQEEVSVLLGPGANIKRSPLCGRNFEYFSEDPYLSSSMAKNHVMGVQSKGVGTSLKHFAVNNQETRRMSVNALVDERTLREIYLASFESVVKESKPWTVMAAYNRVNGEFCCENQYLIQDILRKDWGYDGVVVSDWGATNDQVKGINMGFDLRMPYCGEHKTKQIIEAVENGTLPESKLDDTVRRILLLVKKGTENRRPGTTYDVEAHHALAEKAALESAVLLKNENQVLPIAKTDKIAIIGSLAKFVRYQGGGSSHINATVDTYILEELNQNYPEVHYEYARGYRLKKDEIDEAYVKDAENAGKSADKIVLFLGLPNGWESEGFDRKHLNIPNNQIDLLEKLSKLGKPIIVYLFAGAPVVMDWDNNADAVYAMYTAGQAMPSALLKLLFGKVSPSGKLSETYPLRIEHTPCSLNYPELEQAEYKEGIFVGYRYYEKKALPVKYPFGYGLSYTSFEYGNLMVDKKDLKDTEVLHVSVDITNSGNVEGKETVQLYVADKESSVPKAVKELKGFEKVTLLPGETKTVEFVLDKRSFAYFNTQISDWYVESGEYELLIGSSSIDIRVSETIYVESTVTVRKKYDEYVTMDELGKTAVGKNFMGQMMAGMPEGPSEEEKERMLDDEDNIEDVPMDFAAMGQDMPLIKVCDMTAGSFPYEAVNEILNALNN
ncbi:glycoside hydrolase family 3 C-terminal domain-containing protein [Anaerobium acetethylicum]|uniref:Beta-glucosidase n=1 Tax=Anaerobium acetethylicum TaxID=1619234 RepID=A0A1D3TX30_9FIRM|nr:glycoside hydrolase family 3 C-terminal domain-containing protein [Anaerobium acetethylicum]SCP98837.1 beta-glucosidase [Anaerobium acetethylicum]